MSNSIVASLENRNQEKEEKENKVILGFDFEWGIDKEEETQKIE